MKGMTGAIRRWIGAGAGAAETPVPDFARTILLVEDDAEMRTMLEILFEGQGYHLLLAEDGRAGWKLAQAHPGPIDLVLSDIVMPHMTGIEMAQRISAARPESKVLLVSAYHQGKLPLNQNWAFLPKPYETKALIVKIEEMLAPEWEGDTVGAG
jgi:two-component system cell cycle sensor histidine kinase/response regulator CckA